MARTAITPSSYTANSSITDPAGTAGDSGNGHIISGVKLERLVVRVNNGGGGSINATVKAGANPPALEAGQGDLVVAVGAGAVKDIGPFTSGRFSQKDGSLWLDLSGSTTVTVTAFASVRA